MAQTYSPNVQPPITKPLGAYGMNSMDARSFYYNSANFSYTPYTDTSQVKSYLNLPIYREGNFRIYVWNSLQDTVQVWWFWNGTADSNLVRYNPVIDLYYTKRQSDSLYNRKITSIVLNTSTGNLVTYENNGDSITTNLDGRYERYIDTPTISNRINANVDSIAQRLPLYGGNLSGAIYWNGLPTNSSQLVNKNYVDNLITGLSWKQAVQAATTANIVLSGLQTIDGYSAQAGDRILVKNQTDSTTNGIYIVSSSTWARSTDCSTGDQLLGSATYIINGTANEHTQWANSNLGSITIGTTKITYGQIAGSGTYTNGSGIDLNANSFSLDIPYTRGLFSSTSTTGINYNNSTGTFSLSAIPNTSLSNSTISGVSLGSSLLPLTLGTHLTGGTSYNGSSGVTLGTDATSSNVANAIVSRDASGNFSANEVIATGLYMSLSSPIVSTDINTGSPVLSVNANYNTSTHSWSNANTYTAYGLLGNSNGFYLAQAPVGTSSGDANTFWANKSLLATQSWSNLQNVITQGNTTTLPVSLSGGAYISNIFDVSETPNGQGYFMHDTTIIVTNIPDSGNTVIGQIHIVGQTFGLNSAYSANIGFRLNYDGTSVYSNMYQNSNVFTSIRTFGNNGKFCIALIGGSASDIYYITSYIYYNNNNYSISSITPASSFPTTAKWINTFTPKIYVTQDWSNLQNVTNQGATTTNPITINNNQSVYSLNIIGKTTGQVWSDLQIQRTGYSPLSAGSAPNISFSTLNGSVNNSVLLQGANNNLQIFTSYNAGNAYAERMRIDSNGLTSLFNGLVVNSGTNVIRFNLGSDSTGDIYYRNSSLNFSRLGIGTTGQILTVAGGLPTWATPASSTVTLGGDVTGTGQTGTTITTTLKNTGTAGNYTRVTTDAQGRVSSGTDTAYTTTIQVGTQIHDTIGTKMIIDTSTGYSNLYSIIGQGGSIVDSGTNTVLHNNVYVYSPDSLSEMHDVTLTTPSANQLLQYNGSKWINWTSNYLTNTATGSDMQIFGNTINNISTLQTVTNRGYTTNNPILFDRPNTSTSSFYRLMTNGALNWFVGTNPANIAGHTSDFTIYNSMTNRISFSIDSSDDKIITYGSIVSPAFIKSGGTASQFLKADGSVDNNSYLTASQDAAITGNWSLEGNSLSIKPYGLSGTQPNWGGGISIWGTSNYISYLGVRYGLMNPLLMNNAHYPDWGQDSIAREYPSLPSFVLELDRNGNINIYSAPANTANGTFASVFSATPKVVATKDWSTLQNITSQGATTTNPITANSFIKSGGTSSQFLKADGSVDASTYLTTETDPVWSNAKNVATIITGQWNFGSGATINNVFIPSAFLGMGSNESGVLLTTNIDSTDYVYPVFIFSGQYYNATGLDSLNPPIDIKLGLIVQGGVIKKASSQQNQKYTNYFSVFWRNGKLCIYFHRGNINFPSFQLTIKNQDFGMDGLTLISDTTEAMPTNITGQMDVYPTFIYSNTNKPSLQDVTSQGATTTNSITANSFIKSGGTNSQLLIADGSIATVGSGLVLSGGVLSSTAGGGSVTSVGLSLPNIFSVSGSPITGSGTLTGTLVSQNANLVFASPYGAAGTPTFRSLVPSDLPTIPATQVSGLTLAKDTDVSITTPSTNQLLHYNGSKWINWTPNYLTGNQTITLSGDGTGSGTTSIPLTLNTVNANVGTFGTSTNVGTFTVNGKGLITAASNTAIAFPVTSVNSLTGAISLGLTNLSGVSITTPASGQVLQYNGTTWVNATVSGGGGGTVTSVGLSMPSAFTVTGSPVTSTGTLTVTGAGTTSQYINGAGTLTTFPTLFSPSITSPASGQLLQYNGTNWINWTPNYLTSNQTITLSGDITGSGNTSITTTLKNTGTAGTYTRVTTDVQGRVSSATDTAYLPLSGGTVNGAITASTYNGNAAGLTGLAGSLSIGGGAAYVGNTLIADSIGDGSASGSGYNGSSQMLISWNTLGVPRRSGQGAYGTWPVSISGNAATATSASAATNSTEWSGQTIALTGLSAGQILSYNGSTWVNSSAPSIPNLDGVLTSGNTSNKTMSVGAITTPGLYLYNVNEGFAIAQTTSGNYLPLRLWGGGNGSTVTYNHYGIRIDQDGYHFQNTESTDVAKIDTSGNATFSGSISAGSLSTSGNISSSTTVSGNNLSATVALTTGELHLGTWIPTTGGTIPSGITFVNLTSSLASGSTIYLPLVPSTGQVIIISRTTTGSYTINGNGYNIYYQGVSQTSATMSWGWVLVFDGSEWMRIVQS